MLVVRVSGRLSNYHIFVVYRSPNSDDRIFDCLLNSLAAVQRCDRRHALFSLENLMLIVRIGDLSLLQAMVKRCMTLSLPLHALKRCKRIPMRVELS